MGDAQWQARPPSRWHPAQDAVAIHDSQELEGMVGAVVNWSTLCNLMATEIMFSRLKPSL
jgi:hypothetical protein